MPTLVQQTEPDQRLALIYNEPDPVTQALLLGEIETIDGFTLGRIQIPEARIAAIQKVDFDTMEVSFRTPADIFQEVLPWQDPVTELSELAVSNPDLLKRELQYVDAVREALIAR